MKNFEEKLNELGFIFNEACEHELSNDTFQINVFVFPNDTIEVSSYDYIKEIGTKALYKTEISAMRKIKELMNNL